MASEFQSSRQFRLYFLKRFCSMMNIFLKYLTIGSSYRMKILLTFLFSIKKWIILILIIKIFIKQRSQKTWRIRHLEIFSQYFICFKLSFFQNRKKSFVTDWITNNHLTYGSCTLFILFVISNHKFAIHNICFIIDFIGNFYGSDLYMLFFYFDKKGSLFYWSLIIEILIKFIFFEMKAIDLLFNKIPLNILKNRIIINAF
jgi:hypothetical protein